MKKNDKSTPMVKLFPLTLLAALLAGCAVKPGAPPAGPTVPVAWSTALPDQAPMASIADPQLAELQTRALEANRDLRLMAMRLRDAIAQGRVDSQRLSASVSVSAGRSDSRYLSGGSDSLGLARSHGFSAMASYEGDLWGRLALSDRLRDQQTESMQTDLRAARALLLGQVASRYWQLGSLASQRPLLDEVLSQAQEALAITRLRVREGKLLPIEVDRAAASLQTAQNRRADLDNELLQQRQQLALLLDEPPPGPERPTATLPTQAPQPLLIGTPAAALEQRVDVGRARLSVDAALVRLRLSETQRYPTLQLSAGVGTGDSDWKNWLDKPLGTLAASLVVPLVDWPRLALQRDLARSELEQSALGLRDTVYKALVDIEGRLIETKRLQQQRDSTQVRLDEARQAEQIAALKLELGLINRLDWLQARNARLSNEQDLQQLLLRQWQAHAELCAALGLELRAR
jgi:outer membrane protein TolC